MTGFKCEINYEHKGYLIVDKISGSPKTGYQNSTILYCGENFQEEVCKFDSVEEAKSYIDFLIPYEKNKGKFTAHGILTGSAKSKILATYGVLVRASRFDPEYPDQMQFNSIQYHYQGKLW